MQDFEKRFNSHRKSMNRTKNVIKVGFFVIAGLIVTGLAVAGWAAYEVVQAIQEGGLKSIIEVIWEGSK